MRVTPDENCYNAFKRIRIEWGTFVSVDIAALIMQYTSRAEAYIYQRINLKFICGNNTYRSRGLQREYYAKPFILQGSF